MYTKGYQIYPSKRANSINHVQDVSDVAKLKYRIYVQIMMVSIVMNDRHGRLIWSMRLDDEARDMPLHLHFSVLLLLRRASNKLPTKTLYSITISHRRCFGPYCGMRRTPRVDPEIPRY